MATSGSTTDPYSGRPAFNGYLVVSRGTVSGTSARWNWSLYARNPGGSSSTYVLDAYGWSVNVEGQAFSGSHNLDFRGGQASILLGSGTTGYIDQGGSTRVINFSFSHGPASIFGTAANSGSFTADALATVPGAPPTPTFQSATETSLTFGIAQPSNNGGSAILGYEMRIVSNDGQTLIGTWTGTGSPQSTAGHMTLEPATSYRVLYRARNALGYGGYSTFATMTTLPAAPTSVTLGTPTINSMPVTWSRGDNGAALTGFDLQYADNPGFTGATTIPLGNVTSYTLTSLTPGTTYYVRVRAKASSVNSSWSSTVSKATAEATAPGLSIVPALSGTSATLTLTPPPGSSGVTNYRIERRIGTGAATVYNTVTSPYVVSGLTPGTTYQWRASAFFGGYQSPWTDWKPVLQPRPNVEAGDYFDGNTPDADGIEYTWDGAVNNSPSRASAPGVLGWMTFAEGATDSGGLGVVTQVANPWVNDRAAQVTFFTPPTSAGFRFGQQEAAPGWSEAQAQGDYVGSIYVYLSEPQSLAAGLSFFDDLGTPLGEVVAPAQVVPAETWTRLTVSGRAPADSEHGAVWVTDVTGTGWRAWEAGEQVVADAAMISIGVLYDYFNGDTPDTANWAYTWMGTPHASVSERTALDQAAEDPLRDPDCPPPPAPPAPPTIVDECIVEVGSWRRYWAIIPAQEIRTWLDAVPTVTVTTGDFEARQVRIRYYANPENLPPESFTATAWDAEQIISYMPAHTTLTIDGVSQRVWASVNGAAEIAADRLLYGTNGMPASWPLLSCGTSYLISLDVPLDAPDGNLTIEVGLTTRSM